MMTEQQQQQQQQAAEYARLQGALGVAEVAVTRRPAPRFPFLLPSFIASSSSSSSCESSSSTSCACLGFGLEEDPQFGFTEVSWSHVASLRPRDVILAVNGRPVINESKEAILSLIEEEEEEEEDEVPKGGEVLGQGNGGGGGGGVRKGRSPVRLTLDTRRSWPVTAFFFAKQNGCLSRLLSLVMDGFDTVLLDAQVSPTAKLLCNALGMLLLFPLIEPCFSSLRFLSSRFGPLLVPNATVLLYETVWISLYLTSPFLLLLSRLSLHHSLPTYAIFLLRRVSLLLRALDAALLLPPLLTACTIATTGLSLPTITTEAQLEQELQQLVTNLLVLLFVPSFIGWYLRRFACFCSAYANIAKDTPPQRLGLAMPLSSHFGRREDAETFKNLRSFGY